MTDSEWSKPMEQGEFGAALIWLKADGLVSRKAWDKGECIFLIRGRTVEYNIFYSWKNNANQAYDPPKDIVISDHIDKKMADGTYLTGWTPSQVDMLANDWYIVR